MSEPSLSIIVNGNDHAYMREFGCRCDRCAVSHRRANASASICLLSDQDELLWHLLIDAGGGVGNNLVENLDGFQGEPRVDLLLLTHWHPDHSIGLLQVCPSLKRSRERRGLTFDKIPTWVRHGSLALLPDRLTQDFIRVISQDENEPPGRLLPAFTGLHGSVTIQPVSISHASADLNGRYATAGYVITAPNGRRAAFLWDMDNQNQWLVSPDPVQAPAQAALRDLDYLFVDCNNWEAEDLNGRTTSHGSFLRIRSYAEVLRPRETVLIHISGHEDGPGNPGFGWPDQVWQDRAREAWEGLPGTVSVVSPGERRPL
ncbi:MAG: MBL fold metallo-hydrolase [Chloroflexota bacterium]